MDVQRPGTVEIGPPLGPGSGLVGASTADNSSGIAYVAGVLGLGNTGGKGVNGVIGFGSANGVWEIASAAPWSGVYGENDGDGNGVYGHANNTAASGVYGQNDGAGFGVAGRANSGTGVQGDSSNGTGVWANSPGGTALLVTGTAQFSRSGVATVAGTSRAPKNSVKVTLPITAHSMMTATLQKYVAGVSVVAAVPSVKGGYFTIYLNKAVTTSVGPIAWMVTERP